MVVCKFWESGTCKFGQNCRFEHPSASNRSQPGNRFAAFGNTSSSGGGSFNRSNDTENSYLLSKDGIQKDLDSELPQWILSAYGPGRDAPEQLFGGPLREQSFEEMRLHHLMAVAEGKGEQALSQAQELYQQARQQIQTATGNIEGAIQFITAAGNSHPNRIDICKQSTPSGGTTGEFAVGRRPGSTLAQSNPFQTNAPAASPFGAAAASQGGAFGQPSNLGPRPNPFGTPAFGQPSQPTSAFGQPSQPTSAFGQPSQPASAFGQPSQPASAFGQPSQPASAFGQPSQPTSAFGQPSQLGGGPSAFGQPSGLGPKPSPFGTPSFGQPSQPGPGAGAFGQPSALGQKPNPFGAPSGSAAPNPFSAAATGNNTQSPFAQAAQNNAATPPAANPFGQPAQSANPFGAPSGQPAAPNPFGQPSQPAQAAAGNPFAAKQDAQPNGFASPSMDTQPTNAFAQPTQANPFQQNSPSPFGQPSGGGGFPGAPAAANPFSGTPAATIAQATSAPGSGPYPAGSSRQHPPIEAYAVKTMDGRLSTWKGKPVTYDDDRPGIKSFNGGWTRIWFPDGPPGYYKDTELPDGVYDDKTKAQWQAFTQTGKFEGMMPELPPKREFCLWDI